MFNLAKDDGRVVAVPHIPMLAEKNVRKGFFSHHDYLRLKQALPSYLKSIVTIAYYTGMRRSEILNLGWGQVDFHERIIRLDPHTTKNDDPRIVPMSQEFYDELRTQRQLRDESFPFCQHVFFNHSTGKPIKDFRAAWDTACKRLGLEDGHFHDLRRCGVRNLVRSGVPEKVAMAISGHKTRSIFDRYNIVNEDDIRAAGKAVENYLNQSLGMVQAQVAEFDKKRKVAGRANN